MREKSIEEKLVDAVKTAGGVCWKFTSPGTAGVPDRIVLMPSGKIAGVFLLKFLFRNSFLKQFLKQFCFSLFQRSDVIFNCRYI